MDNFFFFELKGQTYFIAENAKEEIDSLIDTHFEYFRFMPELFRLMYYREGVGKLKQFLGGIECQKNF